MWKFRYGLFISLLMGLSTTSFADNSNNVHYEGTLIALPCTINENTQTAVEFGTIVDKQLYLHGQTQPIPFDIILQDCDPSISNTIILSVHGITGNVTSDGYLMLSPESTAQGIVIGLIDNIGKKIPINSALDPIQVSNGSMAIRLNTFVKVSNQNNTEIIPGNFTSMLYYTLDFN